MEEKSLIYRECKRDMRRLIQRQARLINYITLIRIPMERWLS